MDKLGDCKFSKGLLHFILKSNFSYDSFIELCLKDHLCNAKKETIFREDTGQVIVVTEMLRLYLKDFLNLIEKQYYDLLRSPKKNMSELIDKSLKEITQALLALPISSVSFLSYL